MLYRVVMSDTFDLVRVEGARLILPNEFSEFEFFVHNTVEQREDGTLFVHEDMYSVSERKSGSIVVEFEPSVAAAEALALKRITHAGPTRLHSVIEAAVLYSDKQRKANERAYKGTRTIPYTEKRRAVYTSKKRRRVQETKRSDT